MDLDVIAKMGSPHSPKLQHYWNLTIRLFTVITRTLVKEGSYPSAEVQWVYSIAQADWTIFVLIFFLSKYFSPPSKFFIPSFFLAHRRFLFSSSRPHPHMACQNNGSAINALFDSPYKGGKKKKKIKQKSQNHWSIILRRKRKRKKRRQKLEDPKWLDPINSWDSPNVLSVLPKIAFNIDELLRQARSIPQQVKDNGLLFSLEELWSEQQERTVSVFVVVKKIVKSTKDLIYRLLASLGVKVLAIISGTYYAFWTVLLPSFEDAVALIRRALETWLFYADWISEATKDLGSNFRGAYLSSRLEFSRILVTVWWGCVTQSQPYARGVEIWSYRCQNLLLPPQLVGFRRAQTSSF